MHVRTIAVKTRWSADVWPAVTARVLLRSLPLGLAVMAAAAVCVQDSIAAKILVARKVVINPGGPMIPVGVVPPPNHQKSGGNPAFSRIQVDDSFGARDMLRTANHLVKSGHISKAVREYQKIVEKFGRRVIATGPDSYESVESYIWHLVVRLPAVRQGLYDQLYGLQAAHAVAKARRTGQIRDLISAGRSFFPSAAAAGAMQEAASRLFERGSFAAAARIWLRLTDHPAMAAKIPELLDRAALAAWLAGQKPLALRLAARLARQYPHAMGVVAGKRVSLSKNLAATFKTARIAGGGTGEAAPRRWKTFQGDYRRNKIPAFDTAPSAVMWHSAVNGGLYRPPFEGTMSVAWRNSMQQRLALFGLQMGRGMRPSSGIMFSFPTRQGSTLYLNSMGRVRAVSIASGYELWRYPRGHLPASRLSSNLNTLLQSLDHYSVTAQGRRLYAVIATGQLNQTMLYYSPYGQAASTRLVCLNARTGKPEWTVPVASMLAGSTACTAVSSPMATARSVYMLISSSQAGAGQSRIFLVRLNAADGTVRHSWYLCTVTGATYSQTPLDIIPAMTDGIIYVATGNGAVLAVHAASGRIAWLTLTALAHRAQSNVGWGAVPRQLPWKINPPIVYRNDLIVVDNNSGEQPAAGGRFYVFNRWTGNMVRQWKPGQLSAAYLTLGAVKGGLVTVGRRVEMVNIRTGKIVWKSRHLSHYGRLQARPFLTRYAVYLPLSTGLLRVNVKNGLTRDFMHWPPGGNLTGTRAGNLLVTAHQVVVVNDQNVMDYSRWSDAQRYLAKRIAAAPHNPVPRLTLAEVAYRTGHYDIARQSMARAVTDLGGKDLAIARRIFDVCIAFGRRSQRLPDRPGDAAFFFGQAQLSARTASQQALWRYRAALNDIRLKQAPAALRLLTGILAGRAMRNASLRTGNTTMSAAAVARITIDREIIRRFGRAAYAHYDQIAAALLAKAQASKGVAILHEIVLRYPNSAASTSAALLLADRLRAARRFRKAGEILLAMRQGLSTVSQKAWWLASMARNTADLHHWNAAASLARYGLLSYPASVPGPFPGVAPADFASIIRWIKTHAPAGSLFHRAKLNYGKHTGFSVARPIRGFLLAPLQVDPHWNRYDLFLAAHINSAGVRLRACAASSGRAIWTLHLPQEQRVALLGFQNDAAVLLTPEHIIVVSCKTGKILWSRSAAIAGKFAAGHAFAAERRMMAINNGLLINGPMIVANGYANNSMTMFPSQQAIARHLLSDYTLHLGPHSFQFIKMVRGGLLLEQGNRILAYSLRTGRPLWAGPIGAAGMGTLINCKRIGDQLALAFNTPITSVELVGYRSGKPAGLIHFSTRDYLLWMGAGPAGTLYLSGVRAAMACNPLGNLNTRIWQLHKLADPFPMSTVLTTRGIVLPTLHGIESVDRASGAMLWQRPSLPGGSTAGVPFLGTAINRGTLVLMTPDSLLALSSHRGHIMWKAEFIAQRTPPLVSAHIGNPDIAVIAHGPLGDSPAATVLFLVNQMDNHGRPDNGSLVLSKRLVRSADDPNGPNIVNWEIVNGGIVFAVDSDVFLYHQTR